VVTRLVVTRRTVTRPGIPPEGIRREDTHPEFRITRRAEFSPELLVIRKAEGQELRLEQRRLDHGIVVVQNGEGLHGQSRVHFLALEAGHRRVAIEDEPELGVVAGACVQISKAAARGL
jgi:hypothetical protein